MNRGWLLALLCLVGCSTPGTVRTLMHPYMRIHIDGDAKTLNDVCSMSLRNGTLRVTAANDVWSVEGTGTVSANTFEELNDRPVTLALTIRRKGSFHSTVQVRLTIRTVRERQLRGEFDGTYGVYGDFSADRQ